MKSLLHKKQIVVLLIIIVFPGSILMVSDTGSKKNETKIKTFLINEEKENCITIGINEKFMIKIRSNITTGYSWSPVNVDRNEYVTFLGPGEEDCSDEQSGLKGEPHYECLVFKAVKPGKTSIILNFSRPWEKNTDPLKSVIIFLIIH